MTVLLLVAAIIVGYLSVMSILTPERFTKTRIAREAPIQVRLKEVAHVENAFHDVYNRYAPQHLSLRRLARRSSWYLSSVQLYLSLST